ncbi:hypothetical protein ACWTU6_30135 [Mesorhizobium sp. BHbsci]
MFQVLQECQTPFERQVIKGKCSNSAATLLGDEAQEQADCVTKTADRTEPQPLLYREMIGKK